MENSILNQCYYSNGFGSYLTTNHYSNNTKITTCKLQQNNESRRNKSNRTRIRIKSQYKQNRNFRRIRNFIIGAGIGSGILPFDPLHKAQASWPWSSFFENRRHYNNGKKRILIIMSNTGGGHKASAEAIKAGFEQMYRNKFEVTICDLWMKHSPYPFNIMPYSYKYLVSVPWIWRISYHILNPKFVHIPYFELCSIFIYAKVNEAFDIYKPHLIISVHPLLQYIPLKILNDRVSRGIQRPIPFVTVVTDFTTCHNTWFDKRVTQCFVPTRFCYKLAKKEGLRDDQITLHGLAIRPDFSKQLPSKIHLRKKLGMNKNTPAVLLMGGGEGMGQLENIIDALSLNVGSSCQVVVICGTNRTLAQKLKNKQYPYGMHVIVNGFVNNMNEWMCACDAVVTKAGPGTIAEALICGIPILLNGNIPGQESGNIPYVLDNKVGTFEKDPTKISYIIKEWFVYKKDELKEMSQRAKALGRPDALQRIVRDLAEYCKQHYSYVYKNEIEHFINKAVPA